MELYTPGYKVTEILDETGDSLRRINVNDAELSYSKNGASNDLIILYECKR